MGENKKNRIRLWFGRLRRRFYSPFTYIEQEADDDIKLLEAIANAEWEVWADEPDTKELTTEELLAIDKSKVFERLQKRIPILVYTSGRRLERLTKWLITLTVVLAILTILSIVVAIRLY